MTNNYTKKSAQYPADCCAGYSDDVRAFEAEDMTRSDAQGCADVKHWKIHGGRPEYLTREAKK